MALVFIGFGSNLGDGRQLVESAWNRLSALERLVPVQLSSLYVTQAVDMVSQLPFTNAVGMAETDLSPIELLHRLQAVEREHGRRRDGSGGGYQDRSLDLDLLYYDRLVCATPELTVPHPRITGRLFVLVPLAEIAPDFRDPVTGRTAGEMRGHLESRIEQNQIPPQPVRRIPAGSR